MNRSPLIPVFLQALRWNAFSYITYKVCYLLLSYLLYAKLAKADFVIWSTLLSVIYFGLLLLDCGFRKSVPRFLPEFSSTPELHNRFIRWICIMQGFMLFAALPFYYLLLPPVYQKFGLPILPSLCILGACLFFLQGCLSLMRLIYHAHFWNKQFNSLSTSIVCIECLFSLLITAYASDSSLLLHTVLVIHCVSAWCVISISLYLLPRMPLVERHKRAQVTSDAVTRKFIIHSLFMWMSQSIKALTERNFLVPYIIYSLGPAIGVAFKLTHDAALFFYRIALKTMGVNDTALLAYAQQVPGESQRVLTHLFKTVICLVISLVLAAGIGMLGAHYIGAYTVLRGPFLIFMLSYMIEFLLSPYERLLEVSLCYKALSIAYIPYLVLLALTFYHQLITQWGLLSFICIIQVLRVTSALIMAIHARRLLR